MVPYVQPGDTIVFGLQALAYSVLSVSPTTIVLTVPYSGTGGVTTAYDTSIAFLERTIPTSSGLHYTVTAAQGLMPKNDQFGAAKWTQTDPLNLFASGNVTGYNLANLGNLYVQLPRTLVPAWGEYHVPILPVAQTIYAEGISYMSLSVTGATHTDADKNYVPYVAGNAGGAQLQTFSTLNFGPPAGPATYNTAYSYGSTLYAGMQKFSDFRNLGRQGLQLPPFYGIARLFSVYEANDYFTHGSAYDPTTRLPVTGKATNLLRQNFLGPTFWVEIDADGDSTFILNAACIDITRSPNPITSFSAADFVIESSIFGFDRGFFDLTKEARLVMTATLPTNVGAGVTRAQAVDNTARANNIGVVVSGPNTVVPGPITNADAVVVNYSRTPYMGDAWGSQTNYTDITYAAGPLLTGNAYQLVSTQLNQQALTRPNQKLLEVLSSVGFVTTLGTGRIAGDFSVPPSQDARDIGYEDPAQYPPTSAIQARPRTDSGDFAGDLASIAIGSDIGGLSERLPLGALFRDKDFRGESFGNPLSGPFILTDGIQGGLPGSLPAPPPPGSPPPEIMEAPVETVDLAIGQPGDLLVAVDGNQGNYTLLTNYRVNRGGSVFNASGVRPGGEVASIVGQVSSPTGHTNVIAGRAFLVRNTVTDTGSTEVSAGDELMMLVVTSVNRLTNTNPTLAQCIIGTNGSYEGYSAADLYRIEGHPYKNDNVRNDLNPSTVVLAPRAF
jgi:hypothetical protein